RLCAALAEGAMRDTRSPARSGGDRVSRITDPVDRLVQDLFLARGAREKDDNLIFVRERLLKSEADRAALLDLYRQVWSGKRVQDDETNPLCALLKLSGVASAQQPRPHTHTSCLRVRNPIYRRVFDCRWVL